MLTRAKAISESQLAPKSSQVSPQDLFLDPELLHKSSRSSMVSASGSRRSVISTDALKKQLQLEAAEEKARLLIAAAEVKAKLEEMKMKTQMDLVEKRLCANLADGSSMSSAQRTEEWVARQNCPLRRTTAAQNARRSEPTVTAVQDVSQLVPVTHDDARSASAPQNDNMSASFVAPILKLADAVHNLALGCARNSEQVTDSQRMMSRMAAPKELPTFRGDSLEWIHFKNFYEESTQVCQFSNVENVCRLRKSLQGEAKECVSALLMGNVTAENIMQTLELRFGRPEIIVSKIVNQIRKMPSLPLSYHNDIVSFSIKIKNCVVTVKTIKEDDYLRSPELTSVILSKLPCSLITRWADYAQEHRERSFNMTRIELLSEFLDIEEQNISNVGLSLLQTSTTYKKPEVTHLHSNFQKPHMVLVQTKAAQENAAQKDTTKCRFCYKPSDHVITDCPKFKRALRKDRWSFVRRNRLCPKCLVSDHDKNTCEAPICNIDDCGLPHHVILHWPIKLTERSANAAAAEPCEGVEPDECVANVTSTEVAEISDYLAPLHVLLKYVRVRIHSPNGDIVTDALLDDGSTITMIDERVAEEAGLKGRTEILRVRGAWDNSVLVCQTELFDIEISGEDSKRSKIVARTVKGINLPSQYIQPDSYEHVREVKDSLCCGHMKPLMIIGQDNYHLLVPLEIIEGDPCATRTVLGWSVHGKLIKKHRPHGVTNACMLFLSIHEPSESSLEELNNLVKRSYALDALEVSSKSRQCSEDVRALKILDDTSKQVGDHWEVGLPWKDDSVKMKDSYPTAYMRLQGVEKKMRMNPDFQTHYRERLQHLLENNYAHLYEEPEVVSLPDRLWYLPHFGVDNPNKKKLRLVFDAAAKSHGYSLNDYLLQGPDLLVSLPGILFRFREHRVAVTGDIKDMFLRVQIRKEDQDALRFLWRDDFNNAKQQPTTYVMNSLIFGACCSPFVAQYVKNKNAMLYEKEKPRAVRSIAQNHYVDDLMDSIETEVGAIQLVQDVRNIHKRGGFEIRNWTSNSKAVLASLPEIDLGPSAVKFSIEGTSEGERTLGLYWFPADDVLAFDISLKWINQDILKCLKRPTKREMLSVIMSVFDVQGFLAPVSIKSRILLQDVWRSSLAWDEPVRDKEFAKWKERVPRDETLATLLTHVSVGPSDAIALTPFHFLLDSSSNLPIIQSDSADLCSRKQWRVAQRLADMFWGRWLKEVLSCLLPRTIGPTSDENQLRIGDVVLVVDPASERGYWPRGVIETVYPGADGRVRVVDVKTSRGTLRRRSALRLVRLPTSSRGEEC